MKRIKVKCTYPFDINTYDITEKHLHNMIGRVSDGAGTDGCIRDIEWICQSKEEAENIKYLLRKCSMLPESASIEIQVLEL